MATFTKSRFSQLQYKLYNYYFNIPIIGQPKLQIPFHVPRVFAYNSFQCTLENSRGFDTLNHEILLSKLEACGITGTAHQWITNYFCNRIQFVQIGNSKSDDLRQVCGEPQGSILGPLFFILYINDLPACCNELEFILFADDTSIFFEHNDLDVLTSHLNVQLNNVSIWLKANKLSINVKKTKLMIFS